MRTEHQLLNEFHAFLDRNSPYSLGGNASLDNLPKDILPRIDIKAKLLLMEVLADVRDQLVEVNKHLCAIRNVQKEEPA